MNEILKSLMQDLGNAINDSLSDSESISEAVGEIKKAGYDVFLVIEATIGFNEREETEEEDEQSEPSQPSVLKDGKINLTTSDSRFLRALKISVDKD
jgi:hypothetical protein